jgi:putative FmdB family regulatory protein
VPIYEYRCNKNGHEFEVVQSMSDDPIKKCPECGSLVVRLLFAPAIHFKGSGFHNTDYGTKKRNRDSEKSDGGGSSDAATKSDSAGSGGDSSNDSAPTTKQATAKDRAARGVGP